LSKNYLIKCIDEPYNKSTNQSKLLSTFEKAKNSQ
jgi:hypothetical protein